MPAPLGLARIEVENGIRVPQIALTVLHQTKLRRDAGFMDSAGGDDDSLEPG